MERATIPAPKVKALRYRAALLRWKQRLAVGRVLPEVGEGLEQGARGGVPKWGVGSLSTQPPASTSILLGHVPRQAAWGTQLHLNPCT